MKIQGGEIFRVVLGRRLQRPRPPGRMNGNSAEPAPGINLAHQEVERIIEHLEMVFESQPTEWLVVEPVGELLLRELGYEDMDDFEDALQVAIVSGCCCCCLNRKEEEEEEEEEEEKSRRIEKTSWRDREPLRISCERSPTLT